MSLADRVRGIVDRTPAFDLHTHLFPPSFSRLCLWGIDELVTYHYLSAEALRAERITPEDFFAMEKSAQADFIWDALFVRQRPLSEACAGVLTVLEAYGLDPRAKSLTEARSFFAGRKVEERIDQVLWLSRVKAVVMTNDPLDPVERAYWESGTNVDDRFSTALRLDPVLNVPSPPDPDCVREYVEEWIGRLKPLYAAVSLPDTFAFPDDSPRTALLRDVVLPVCRHHGLPFAMMMGVRRQVNPRLQSAGDGVGVADLSALEHLAESFPDNRFLVTTLARENAHGLCVVARKFANVRPFGCWWFMNNPSIVEDVTLMRLEMLGTSFVPQHSDARILEQLIYKWEHARRAISAALTRRYDALAASGFHVTDDEISTDVEVLLTGNAEAWVGPA